MTSAGDKPQAASSSPNVRKGAAYKPAVYLPGSEMLVGLKFGLLGGLAVAIIYLLSLIRFNNLQYCVVVPMLILAWSGSGVLAAMFNAGYGPRNGLRVGCLAGAISGICGGLAGMIVAVLGSTFRVFGEGFAAQFSESQLSTLDRLNLGMDFLSRAGSVIGAFFVCGLLGVCVAAVFGALGGAFYTRIK